MTYQVKVFVKNYQHAYDMCDWVNGFINLGRASKMRRLNAVSGDTIIWKFANKEDMEQFKLR